MTVLIIIFLTAILALFAGVYNQGKYSRYLGIAGLILAFYFSFSPELQFFSRFNTMFEYTANAALFSRISIFVTLLIFFLGAFAFNNHRSHQSELYALMLFSLCGAIILFGFRNLVTLFIGIEILSIPLYVMAGSNKTDLRSVEASMKYFLMGAFATGFLLFGVALIYGSTGSFDLFKINLYSQIQGNKVMFTMGIILMMAAMAFKVALAPFHTWSPDVYQGSPSLITSFMASVVKIAGFYTFFKLMTIAFPGSIKEWINIVGVLVIITLLLANAMGLAQSNAKRMLAYSSVSHAGYLGLIFFGYNNASSYFLGFYLLAYSLATVGVFMTLIWVEKHKRETSFAAFNGLGKSEPILATAATVSMLSMAGIPLTAGFIGKFNIFSQAMQSSPFLVLVAVLGSAVSIAYYLRLIIAMFFKDAPSTQALAKSSITYKLIGVVVVLFLIAIGVFPDLFAMLFVSK